MNAELRGRLKRAVSDARRARLLAEGDTMAQPDGILHGNRGRLPGRLPLPTLPDRTVRRPKGTPRQVTADRSGPLDAPARSAALRPLPRPLTCELARCRNSGP